jgi:hypothetical protein
MPAFARLGFPLDPVVMVPLMLPRVPCSRTPLSGRYKPPGQYRPTATPAHAKEASASSGDMFDPAPTCYTQGPPPPSRIRYACISTREPWLGEETFTVACRGSCKMQQGHHFFNCCRYIRSSIKTIRQLAAPTGSRHHMARQAPATGFDATRSTCVAIAHGVIPPWQCYCTNLQRRPVLPGATARPGPVRCYA